MHKCLGHTLNWITFTTVNTLKILYIKNAFLDFSLIGLRVSSKEVVIVGLQMGFNKHIKESWV